MIQHHASLRNLLAQYRDSARSEREKGNYFERLAVDFIKNDPGMAQEYEDAWLFSEWAATHDMDGRDTGIDAVARIRGETRSAPSSANSTAKATASRKPISTASSPPQASASSAVA